MRLEPAGHSKGEVVAAYFVADIDVTDPEGYKEYAAGAGATVETYGGRYLVRAGATRVVEGDPAPKRFVIIEFPDMAALDAWYSSDEYRPLRDIRQRCSTAKIFTAEGV
jgi:uncharacterized protein (DUF1330 family)